VEYDVFLSYHRAASGALAHRLCDTLKTHGLEVFFDENEIDDFAGISARLSTGLARSKALLALYSKTYPTRRACQFELTDAFVAAQRAGDPRRRVLVVNPEEGVEHIEPLELRDALFRRLTVADSPEVVADVAASVARHVRGLEGLLGEIGPLVVPWYGRRMASSPSFVGRVQAMWELHSKLHASELRPLTGAAGPAVVQVRGLGGIGKTMLAQEYALRFSPAYPGGVFWLNALGGSADAERLSSAERDAERARQVRELARDLGAAIAGLTEPDDVEAALKQELERRGKPFLWLVDDVPGGLDADLLTSWFAPLPLGKTLMTTRSRAYGELGVVFEPGVLAPDAAEELLAHHRSPSGESEATAAKQLAVDLGYHALALEVAGAEVSKAAGSTPFADFRAELGEPGRDALELAAELEEILPTGHERSIARTLLSGISTLGEEGTDMLRIASLLASAAIPATIVDAIFAEADGLDELDARRRGRRARDQAERASLAEGEGAEGAQMVHPLVTRTMRFADRDAEQRQEQLREAALRALSKQLDVDFEAALAADLELVPHARQLATTAADPQELDLLSLVGHYDYVRGSFRSAHELGQRVLDGRRATLGERHPDTLAAMSDLAATLRWHDELDAARALHQQVLDGRRELLGERHPDTLTAMANLATTRLMQGEVEVARELQQQVLDGRRELFGERHPDTLTAMSDLGATLQTPSHLRDLDVARKLLQQALEGRRGVLGERHPDTLTAMHNLAATLYAQGELDAARDLAQQVLDARREVTGERHPLTLMAMEALASVLDAQGELDAARKLEQQVLEGRRDVLGERHPHSSRAASNLESTLRAAVNLAAMKYAQGELDAARELEQGVLATYRDVLGVRDPRTLKAMNNLSLTLYTQGELDAARELEQQVLEGRRDVLGERDPGTLEAMNNLALILRAQGKLDQADELEQRMQASPKPG
jgi:hypothetical protein